jgi:formate hydrogenlyase subunit 3/multisubunit Na+/H+ antiporter MnhD subunit
MFYRRFFLSLMVFWELVRPVVLVLLRAEPDPRLPVSWYAAAPLLVFPLLLALLYRFDSKNEPVYAKLYILAKLLSTLGIAAYGGQHLSAALSGSALFDGYNLFKPLGILLIFLIIDGILAVLILCYYTKNHRKNDVISD